MCLRVIVYNLSTVLLEGHPLRLMVPGDLRKRRSRPTPPAAKRPPFLVPGTHGPFEEDRVRTGLQQAYPGAFLSQDGIIPIQGNENILQCPANPRRPRDRPDLEDVVTQQTELLAAMLERLNQCQAAAPQPGALAEQPVDPDFVWTRLTLPSETNFPVPGDGTVQRMATSLYTKVPTLTGRDQHEARFVLQVISMWPDLSDEDRRWAYQRLNVYCIVASLGWSAATAACSASTVNTDYFLPPGTVIPQQANYQRQQGTRRQQQQQQAPPPAPAPAPARRGGRRNNRQGRGRGNNPA